MLIYFSCQDFDHIENSDDSNTPEDKITLILALYNCHITGLTLILEHPCYEITYTALSTGSETVGILYQSLQLSIKRYLQGHGHLDHSVIQAIVHPTDMELHCHSAAVQSVLLMITIWSSDLQPLNSSWGIQVHIPCFHTLISI